MDEVTYNNNKEEREAAMFFERELYAALLEWARKSSQALYLEGPRQVGKTELLKKLGRERFSVCVYIDLREAAEKFEIQKEYFAGKFGRSSFSDEKREMWEAIFLEFDPAYVNDPNTLVILDEIQQSPIAYNSIRDIRRSLKSRLAVSGSYLGIAKQSDEYWEPAGDLSYFELASLSFTEFLKANDIWEEYAAIQTFDLSELNEREKDICERVRKLYGIYCGIGGYPDVVREWVENHDLETCSKIVASLLRALYKESSSYFGGVIGTGLWSRTLERVAAHMVTKSGDLDTAIAQDVFRGDDSKGLEIRRKDKLNALKWLEDCKIVGMAQVYGQLNHIAVKSGRSLFFFRDMGIMRQLCENTMAVLPSDLDGMIAENFVFLSLLSQSKLFVETDVHSYAGNLGQIDFVMHSKAKERYGIEVKFNRGSTKSAEKALREGKIAYLVRVQGTYGSIGEKQSTIPIFMLDKLNIIVCGRRRHTE